MYAVVQMMIALFWDTRNYFPDSEWIVNKTNMPENIMRIKSNLGISTESGVCVVMRDFVFVLWTTWRIRTMD